MSLSVERPELAGLSSASTSRLADFTRWLAAERGLHLPDYPSLWSWSVRDLAGFWGAVADYFDVGEPAHRSPVLARDEMPGAVWFPDLAVSFAREVLERAAGVRPAIVAIDETGAVTEWSWGRLVRETSGLAQWLRQHGVRPGDRVVGYLGNRPEAVVGLLASAAVGATWAVCNQDVAAAGAAARFAQLSPTVLLTATSARYAGRDLDHTQAVRELRTALPSVTAVVVVGDGTAAVEGGVSWAAATAPSAGRRLAVDVPFDHPLWVLFSSGTTGTPKGIVHGHGGMLLQQLVGLGLHFDVRAGDRFFWYCSTSWVMWNLQVACLLLGATAVLYDGSPTHPDAHALWRIAEEHRVTHLGMSPGLLALMQKQELEPATRHDLSALRVLGVTGAPLPAPTAAWAREQVGVPLNVISGGTDVATAFVGGNPLSPEPPPGRMGPPWLGVAATAFDTVGAPVRDDVGELVVTRPMPAMPVQLWDDPGMRRYTETWFSTYDGVWRQGDWATFRDDDGDVSVEVHGRSDATLNRNGVRLGTAEIYAAVEQLPEVVEALVVGVELPGGDYAMPMFLHLAPGTSLDDELAGRLRAAIRTAASARHVPDRFLEVPGLPHTLTGKRLEVPVKRLLLGHAPADVVAPSAVDRPELLALFTPDLLSPIPTSA